MFKKKQVNGAVLQALGGVGNAKMLDHDETLPARALVYRLVSLTSDSPWGDGLLLKLAHSTDDDTQLEKAVFKLLKEAWEDCTIRASTKACGTKLASHHGKRLPDPTRRRENNAHRNWEIAGRSIFGDRDLEEASIIEIVREEHARRKGSLAFGVFSKLAHAGQGVSHAMQKVVGAQGTMFHDWR